MTMRLKLYTLLCISFLLIFTACNQDDDPVPAEKVTRTVLAYAEFNLQMQQNSD